MTISVASLVHGRILYSPKKYSGEPSLWFALFFMLSFYSIFRLESTDEKTPADEKNTSPLPPLGAAISWCEIKNFFRKLFLLIKNFRSRQVFFCQQLCCQACTSHRLQLLYGRSRGCPGSQRCTVGRSCLHRTNHLHG